MTAVHSVFKSVYAQATGVVFAGRNALDFISLRMGVVRIPEVSLRLREAQRILDGLDIERIDLLSIAVSDDDAFFRNIKVKSLLSAIVQVGLYDRLVRSQRVPDVMVGCVNGDSALLVCAGQKTFESMILSSAAVQSLAPLEKPAEKIDTLKLAASNGTDGNSLGAASAVPLGLVAGAQVSLMNLPMAASGGTSEATAPPLTVLPSLSGVSLNEFRAFLRSEDGGGRVEIGQPAMELRKLLTEVVEHHAVTRFINIGPGVALANGEYELIGEAAGADEVTVMDSIDLDPMLNWFWKQMRPMVANA